ncbi:MAG: hypothetical protein ACPG49_07090, partial [Chitinophagales bacterium]
MDNVQSLEQIMDSLESRGYVESLAWIGDKLRMGGITLNPNQVKIIGSYEIEEEESFSKVFALTTDAGEQGYLIDLGG